MQCCLDNSGNVIPQHELLHNLTQHLGSGSFGIVVGNDNHCIKILGRHKLSTTELRYSQWASDRQVGPLLICAGTILLSRGKLLQWADESRAKELPVPRWIRELPEGETVEADFLAFERWDTTLFDVLLRFPLTERLIAPIVDKYQRHLKVLREHHLVHGDLLPRNILVRMDGDQLTDICFTDFADAFFVRTWFLNEYIDESYRKLTIRCFTTFKFNSKLQQLIRKHTRGTTDFPFELTPRECFYRWLLYNPHNLDLCVLECLRSTLDLDVQISTPIGFQFDLAWDDRGKVEVSLCHQNFRQSLVISGFKTMAQLRKSIARYCSPRFAKLLFVTLQDKVIAQEKECRYWPSAFIRKEAGRLCILMEEFRPD
jgi:hypothetical protein